ncbi:MAG: hypothetical protein HYT08_03505 [Candidatus Levybacteria bacterium]|nr:hypothetical protein [Candidatus Levybacteria bacterium]
MKKILFLLVFFSFYSFSINFSFAQGAQDSTASAEVTEEIKYALPYPGLLPDNPLYFLKAIRDRVVNFLISDSVKKADFNLLQADKRLNEGVMLFEKGKAKHSLAVTTVSKAENYFDEAIRQINQAKEQKKETKDITGRLYQAALKHEEVIKNLEVKAEGQIKDGLKSQAQRVAGFQKRVKELML